MPPWDLLVIGGGTAGIVAARAGAGFGARVLLVERERTGGDCLWTGCVPSKAIIAAARAANTVTTARRLGIHVADVRVDFAQVMDRVRSAIATIESGDSPESLESAGVAVRFGNARFRDPRTVEIDGEPVAFRYAVIATGSGPALVDIDGVLDARPLTSDTVWDLDELPGRLAILGAGTVGCELGQAFARLGSRVTMVEANPRLLAREDPDASEVIAAALRRDGVTLHLGAQATAVSESDVRLSNGAVVGFDRLLVAVGRRARVDALGLGPAGIDTDQRGYIHVDSRLRTSNRRVWAAGDVTGHPAYTHTAAIHGSVAAGNALLGLHRRAEVALQPRVTFTDPEVAAFGVVTGGNQRARLAQHTVPNRRVDRAVTDAALDGFTRILVDRKGRLVGATLVSPRAGEVLPELSLAARHGLRTRDLSATTHPYPTYGYGVWSAAVEELHARLRRPATARMIRLAAAIRRR